MSGHEFSVTATTDAGGATVLTCGGDVDIATVDRLAEAIDKTIGNHPAELRIELTGVPFLGSDGLRLLVRTTNRCADEGIGLHLVVSPEVRRVMEVSGVISYLPLE